MEEIREIKQGGVIYHPVTSAEAVKVGGSTLDVVLKGFLDGSLSVEEFKKQFLSKITADEAKECITFLRGIRTKHRSVIEGGLQDSDLESESAWSISYDNYGNSVLTVDKLRVKLEAVFTSVVIERMNHVNGGFIQSCCAIDVLRVEDIGMSYRCYFETGGGNVVNMFEIEDQARCLVFTGNKQKYYWCLVVNVGDDFIDLSKIDKDGLGVPEDGDSIHQLGNRVNSSRQSAIILNSYGVPEIISYEGINSYTLHGKESFIISPKGNRFTGDFTLKSGSSIEDELEKRRTFTLVLSNEMSSVACDSAGNTVGALPTTEVSLYEGTELRTDWVITLVCAGCEAVLAGNVITVTSLTEDNATVKVVASKSGESSISKVMSISKVRAGESPILVVLYTTSGNLTINKGQRTTIYAKVFRGDDDITEEIMPSSFSWERTSADTSGDVVWNELHVGYGKEVELGDADVSRRALFDCIVNINN